MKAFPGKKRYYIDLCKLPEKHKNKFKIFITSPRKKSTEVQNITELNTFLFRKH